ncbi:hypothetical protein CIG75_07045 [Tumebacillus algifaecis]|uniref:Uncharacterized protein n=1 Tax=Tumebacillus algifaecis TaxID=1214604 RepID=A0A223CZQ7_9BACL|nr:hypothetical protein [Tumebacillus algifaecis]ASS74755.1 hypothetical protein CIG75_07045 [Tumebacillus algifaecis]
METMTQERRRLIKRFVVHESGRAELRLEQLMNNLRQQVQAVREEQPELCDYQLYDLTFSFHENGMMVQMEFRR